ncbi:undecaprenyl/decaprenyl-phosphate alpha-N-acetylglucosaminyl 1-phosphate transferase [Parabacteroides sp. TM07-1AC]|uniref:glycosyltransferase family 4 protein n=1 Tax=Parabacteroides sp. TM07-1AC TaxID=2292363 RepID=UPI000EFE8F2D|nr:MraY family glycosyltransferase [Parabacteroides sp. TM07-1AC]RHU24750.1 undecaprenyl/decaprenyl-phosphate alpha-N-acetylglucosaminyl 1-phosphate transferase [Parabacteroides sp. TM07-1AC]
MATDSITGFLASALGEKEKAEFLIVLCFLISLFFSAFVLPRVLVISKRKRLYDDPNARKSHTQAVPRLGGFVFVPAICISLSFTTAVRFMMNFPFNSALTGYTLLELLFLLTGALFLYLVGVKDDLIGVRYRKKFMAQFLVASLFPLSGLYLNNMYGLFGVYELPALIAVPFSIVLVVYITNAINLMDGIDGLAAGGSLISFITFGILFFLKSEWVYCMLAFSIVGCVLPFLFYNTLGSVSHGTKIFMGDSGSLSLGYLLAFFAIKYAMYIPESGYHVEDMIIPFSLLFIPVFDALRVMIVRFYQRVPVFLADRNHIHHKCLDAGFTHLQATGLLLGYTLIMLLFNLMLVEYVNFNIVVVVNMLFGILMNYLLGIKIGQRKIAHKVSMSGLKK